MESVPRPHDQLLLPIACPVLCFPITNPRSGRIIFGVVPRLDDTERERLSALIKQARELRDEAKRLQNWSEALQKQVEEQRCAFDDTAFHQK
jgi:hypothetical protein